MEAFGSVGCLQLLYNLLSGMGIQVIVISVLMAVRYFRREVEVMVTLVGKL